MFSDFRNCPGFWVWWPLCELLCWYTSGWVTMILFYFVYQCHMELENTVYIGLGNGLLPVWCKAITWTNDDFLSMPLTPDIFSLAEAAWKHHRYPCFCIFPLEFGVNIDIHKHGKSEVLCSNRYKSPDCKYMENILIDFIWLNVQAKYLIQAILYHYYGMPNWTLMLIFRYQKFDFLISENRNFWYQKIISDIKK